MQASQAEHDHYDLFVRSVHTLTEHPHGELRGLCPFHEDHTPSFTANRETGLWKCFGCGAQGNAYQFAERLGERRDMGRTIEVTYPYHDEHGAVLFEVVRFAPKGFAQRRPDGNGGWNWSLNGVRRVLYRLPEILTESIVFVVEGEKDADRLWSLSLPATTNPQGAGKWRAEYSQALADKQVAILPDNDEAGEQHALTVARSLLPVAKAVKIVRLPGLPPKGDVSDWLDAGHTRDEFLAILKTTPLLQPDDLRTEQKSQSPREADSGGEPTTASEPPWPVLADDALHGLAGDIVRAIDPYTEADPVATLLNTLTAFGNCINSAAHARVQHDCHPARLFVVQVGDTSKGRKGTGWSTPRYLFSLCDAAWTQTCIKSGLSSAEGLIYHVRDALYKKQPLKQKGRVIGYESVMIEEAVEDKRLLILEPEFASTLTVMNRDGNTLSAVMREAWDSGDLATLTRNSPLKATGAHISILAHVTKAELLARLDDTSKANGFGNRFLWALVRRSKELPEGATVPDEILLPLAEKLTSVTVFARTASEIKRDDETRELWRAVYHDLSEGKPGLLGAVLSRAEAQVLRLSEIYALLDTSDVVRVEHLRAALAVWEYCERSAVLIFGKRLGDPTADRILEALRNAGSTGMTEKQIYDLFGGHKSTNERARALTLLVQLGLATSRQEETAGRPRTVWRAA
jgi:hypothetical protein